MLVQHGHSLFCRYSPKTQVEIGKYTVQHGVTAAVCKFSKQLGHPVRVSTVRSIKHMLINLK